MEKSPTEGHCCDGNWCAGAGAPLGKTTIRILLPILLLATVFLVAGCASQNSMPGDGAMNGSADSAVQHSVVGTWVTKTPSEYAATDKDASVITFYADGTTSGYGISAGIKSGEGQGEDWSFSSNHDRETLTRRDPSLQVDVSTSYVTFSQNSFTLEDVVAGTGGFLPAGQYYREGTPEANKILEDAGN